MTIDLNKPNLDTLRSAREQAMAAGIGSGAWIKCAQMLMDALPAIYDMAKTMNEEARRLKGATVQPVKCGSVGTAGELIAQLQAFDANTPLHVGFHADYQGERRALARPVSMSRERVNGRFIGGDASVPHSLVIWGASDERLGAAAPTRPDPTPGQVNIVRQIVSTWTEADGGPDAMLGVLQQAMETPEGWSRDVDGRLIPPPGLKAEARDVAQ